MKICVAQTKSIAGEIEQNITNHQAKIALAAAQGADMIIFPELSLTGYEPTLASELATTAFDTRFDAFQTISDKQNIIIGAGIPLKTEVGILISMLIFQPNQPRQTYSKQFLHADEYPYFIHGVGDVFLEKNNHKIGFAICYELSITAHSENAYQNGANIYIASVAKTTKGVAQASKTLSETAKKYGMTVLMANCIGYCDNFESAGSSAIWDTQGLLIAQLDDANEGILLFDTQTLEVTKQVFNRNGH